MMKKIFNETLRSTSLLFLMGVMAPVLLKASDGIEDTPPAPVNPLMVIDTLKMVIEDVHNRTLDATHTRFKRKATTLGKVRRKLASFQKEHDETQDRLNLLKDQREEIAVCVEEFVQALRRIHHARNQEGNELRSRIKTAYTDAGFRSRAHFESQIASEERALACLKREVGIREALLERNAAFTQLSKAEILHEIEARHRSLDLTNVAMRHAVDEALEHVFCLD